MLKYGKGAGILRDKTFYIPNGNTQNFPFCRLQLVGERMDTQFSKPTNQHSLKVPKVVKLINKKMLI